MSKFLDVYNLILEAKIDDITRNYEETEKRQAKVVYKIVTDKYNANTAAKFAYFIANNFDQPELQIVLKYLIDNWKNLDEITQNQIIKGTETYDELKDLAMEENDLKEDQGKYTAIHNSENWLVVRPLSHQSSIKFGRKNGTNHWCTAVNSKESLEHWNQYKNAGVALYYAFDKTQTKIKGDDGDGTAKFGIAVYPQSIASRAGVKGKILECYDAKNRLLIRESVDANGILAALNRMGLNPKDMPHTITGQHLETVDYDRKFEFEDKLDYSGKEFTAEEIQALKDSIPEEEIERILNDKELVEKLKQKLKQNVQVRDLFTLHNAKEIITDKRLRNMLWKVIKKYIKNTNKTRFSNWFLDLLLGE